MKISKDDIIQITKADYLGNYQIRLKFDDESEKTIDFKEFILNSRNPMTYKYTDKKKFKAFKIEYGDLIWGDYEMCFPVWDLHEGKI